MPEVPSGRLSKHLLHPVTSERVAVVVGDLLVPRGAEEAEGLRLQITRVEPQAHIPELSRVPLELLQKAPPETPPARRRVQVHTLDLRRLVVESLDAGAADGLLAEISDDPRPDRRCDLGGIRARNEPGIPAWIAPGDVGEIGPLQLHGHGAVGSLQDERDREGVGHDRQATPCAGSIVARMPPGPRSSAEQGRAARAETPRSSHGAYEPAAARADPIALLERQAVTRLPELVPIRYGRMLASPLAFYRGAAGIMAADLATTPRTGFTVQCCGDAHLSNFGIFGSPERRLVFDINDFDETLPGPWEWDVKRLAASLMVAAGENDFSAGARDNAVLATVGEYRVRMGQFAKQRNLDVWYARIEVDALARQFAASVGAHTLKRAGKLVSKARTRDNAQALAKLTRMVDGLPRIVSQPPLIVPLDELVESERERTLPVLQGVLRTYARSLQADRRVLLDQFEMVDFARKTVGIGSVGTRSWIALLLGRHNRDPLFLQIKEAQPSVLERFLAASTYENAGQRIVVGQRLMQATSDIFLGWLKLEQDLDGEPRDFYVRQLSDWKGAVTVDRMTPQELTDYGRLCGATLARAHARSGDRVAIAAYLGSGGAFDRAILAFSHAYAGQNQRDYAALVDAVETGRVIAEIAP
jgi:uncharacterized protein (DUF2252 family)